MASLMASRLASRCAAHRPGAACPYRRAAPARASCSAAGEHAHAPAAVAQQAAGAVGRRALLALSGAAAAAAGACVAPPEAARRAAATPLAPLGKASERVGGPKLTGLTPDQVAGILARNLRDGQYFITGDLTPEVFADDCRFVDPTNDIVGLSRYVKALGILFDASYSAVRLRGIRVTAPDTIEADWLLGGYLKFPWHPRVEPFQGHTVYRLNADGLVAEQRQTWAISAGEALRETFTPGGAGGLRTDIRDLPR